MAKKQIEVDINIYNWEKGNLYNSSPLITGKIDMVPITFLIDTGASISFINKSFIEGHPRLNFTKEIGEKKYLLNMLGEGANSNEIIFTKNLTFGKQKFEQEFCLIDLHKPNDGKASIYQGIIGFDFLMQNKIKLNFHDFSFAI